MDSEKLGEMATVTAGTSPKGELINSQGLGLPFFQGTKEFGDLFPTAERFTEHPVRVAKKGEILIGVRAPVGEVNFALQDSAIGRGVMAVNAKNPQHENFLFYYLKNLEGKWDSLGSTGSVFENLSAATLREISVPGGLHKKQIGDVLLNLDLKIQANRSLSKTLEGIAQTVFKSWFIDFDPVSAKMAGGKPVGMDDATAALFPESMEESEIGLIPMGWKMTKLGEILSALESGKRPRGGAQADGIPSIGAESVRSIGQFNYAAAKFIPSDFYFEMPSGKVRAFDVLIYKDGAGAGSYVTMFGEGFPFEEFAINEHVFLLRSEVVPQSFLFHWLNQVAQKNLMIELAQKSAQPGLNQQDTKSIPVLVPSREILRAFSELVDPLLKGIMWNSKQSKSLEDIRNSLLPRLISGKLQIPEEMLAS
jgi:type I restriction enzyme S subunit